MGTSLHLAFLQLSESDDFIVEIVVFSFVLLAVVVLIECGSSLGGLDWDDLCF